MTTTQRFIRLGLALAAIATLGACTVVPAQPGYYRAPPPAYGTAYPAYPAYGYPPPAATVYYGTSTPYYGNRHDHRHYDRGYEDRRRDEAVLPPPLQLHRDVRRSLGLPRLPGMP